MMDYCHPLFHAGQETILQKSLPTMISASVVLALFFIGRYFDSKLRQKSIRSQWYLSIIIEPNLTLIEAFITNLCQQLKQALSELESACSQLNHKDYLTKKSLKIGEFQSIKRRFEIDFLYLVRMHYPEIAEDLTKLLQNFEDRVTGYLDKQVPSTDDFIDVEQLIKQFKNNLLVVLYKPLILKQR